MNADLKKLFEETCENNGMRYRVTEYVCEVTDNMYGTALIAQLKKAMEKMLARNIDSDDVFIRINDGEIVMIGSRRATPEEEPAIKQKKLEDVVMNNQQELAKLVDMVKELQEPE